MDLGNTAALGDYVSQDGTVMYDTQTGLYSRDIDDDTLTFGPNGPPGKPVHNRSYIDYDTSPIADNSEITRVVWYCYCHDGSDGDTTSLKQMTQRGQDVANGQTLYTFINAATPYASGLTLFGSPGYKEYDLGAQAATDLRNQLGANWFSLGIDLSLLDPAIYSQISLQTTFTGGAKLVSLGATVDAATPARVVDFAARALPGGGQVALSWESSLERDHAGFRVRRADEAGRRQELPVSPLPGGRATPRRYVLVDEPPAGPARYELVELDTLGRETPAGEAVLERAGGAGETSGAGAPEAFADVAVAGGAPADGRGLRVLESSPAGLLLELEAAQFVLEGAGAFDRRVALPGGGTTPGGDRRTIAFHVALPEGATLAPEIVWYRAAPFLLAGGEALPAAAEHDPWETEWLSRQAVAVSPPRLLGRQRVCRVALTPLYRDDGRGLLLLFRKLRLFLAVAPAAGGAAPDWRANFQTPSRWLGAQGALNGGFVPYLLEDAAPASRYLADGEEPAAAPGWRSPWPYPAPAPRRRRPRVSPAPSPTASPDPGATPGVSPSAAPTASPGPTAGPSPSASPAPSPSPTPAAPTDWELLDPPSSTVNPSLKLMVTEDGVQRVAAAALAAAGWDPAALDAAKLRLFNRGAEVPLFVSAAGAALGEDDYLEFFGRALRDNRYSLTNVYWLVVDNTLGGRPPQEEAAVPPNGGAPAGAFLCTRREERQELYWEDAPGDPDDDRFFFGDLLYDPALTPVTLVLDHLAPPAAGDAERQIRVRYKLQGISALPAANDHLVELYLNGRLLDVARFDGLAACVGEAAAPQSWLVEGANELAFSLPGQAWVDYDWALIDWLEVDYWRTCAVEGDALELVAPGAGETALELEPFAGPGVVLYELDAAGGPRRAAGAVVQVNCHGDAWELLFNAQGGQRYYAAGPEARREPAVVARPPAALRAAGNRADYLMVAPAEFLPGLAPLAAFHEGRGLKVLAAGLTDVYDEFNYGIVHPAALRSFFAWAREHWARPAPRFALLVGDTTHDPLDFEGWGVPDYLPVRWSYNPGLGETADDGWYARLDGDADRAPDLALGRLPVQSVQELEVLVAKLTSRRAAPRRSLVVNDDGERLFAAVGAETAARLAASYPATRIDLNDYAAPADCRRAILGGLNAGAALAAYVGHGSIRFWAHEKIFRVEDVPQLAATAAPPLFLMLNCASGYFVYPAQFDSLAEVLLRAEGGGAWGVISSGGVTYPTLQRELAAALLRELAAGRAAGEALRQAAAELAAGHPGAAADQVLRTFCLLGDPAQGLAP